jgi:HEAT repeat protein
LDILLVKVFLAQGVRSRVPVGVALRALEIIDAISTGQRVVLALSHLTNDVDRRIRSKAALVIGRRVKNVNWLYRNLLKEDPRIRANVMESIWGNQSRECLLLFRCFQHDSNTRLRANAVYGMYLQSPEQATPLIGAMSQDPDPLVRRATAWLIGKTADPRFLELLRPLFSDSDQKVRAKAFQSLGCIKNAQKPDPDPGTARNHATAPTAVQHP